MTVIARDAVASDHLVYAWPFPLGPECEVSCGDDEQVVMCPSWLVGDRLGPGRHRWRTPDPMRPVAAFFVLTSPVEASFDMTTSFMVPSTGQPVRVRAIGSIQIRCADPGLLIAQFVGLPFDHVNDGILRSVSRSVERMLARLLTRRVVMAASPYAVTDPSMLGGIVEELVAYNPTAGAVFGVELIRMGHLTIVADDGSTPYVMLPNAANVDWSGQQPMQPMPPNGDRGSQPAMPNDEIPLLETARGRPPSAYEHAPPKRHGSQSDANNPQAGSFAVASGEIVVRKHKATEPGIPAAPAVPAIGTNPPAAKAALAVEVPRSPDEITEPGVKTPVPGAARLPTPSPVAAASPSPSPSAGGASAGGGSAKTASGSGSTEAEESEVRGSILGIGVGHIGSRGGVSVSGEIPMKVAPGQRVLVPGPNGLMQSATVRQLLQGYYELEVGSSGETIWVPIGGVVPE